MTEMHLRVGVDTGGTFTDVVALEDGRLRSYKLPSTPGAFETAVIDGAAFVAQGNAFDLLHSTTVATNALLERKGAKTALITTEGFQDALEIGRQNRPYLYDWQPERVPFPVPRSLRFTLPERVGADGQVVRLLDMAALPEIIGQLQEEGVTSVAVVFLFSFLNPAHEQQVGRRLAAAGFSVSLSHEVLPVFREVARGAATVANAYVRPVMEAYLGRLAAGSAKLGCRDLRVVQSNGGALTPARAGADAVQTLLSGPAAGVMGACRVARAGGHDLRLITFDMGGTSTDVALIRGMPVVSTEQTLGGFPVAVPMVDVHTVGAGGGSVAALDAGGALRVGPESAGADPGPACYGHADLPTVTDAHVVLGHLRPESFLQGRMQLYPERSQAVMAALGAQAGGQSAADTARDVLRLVNTRMESAIRVISVQRGHDPAEFTLVGFGGAGGLHVFTLAEALNMQRVLVPCHPGVLSALGAVATPLSQETAQTVMWQWTAETPTTVMTRLQEMAAALKGRFEADGIRMDVFEHEFALDMRYTGQSHELRVPVCLEDAAAAVSDFHALHRQRYGHAEPAEPVEVVTLWAVARVPAPEFHFPELRQRLEADPPAEISPGIWKRDRLFHGDAVAGPALVLEDFSTIRIPAGWQIAVDRVGNLVGKRMEEDAGH